MSVLMGRLDAELRHVEAGVAAQIRRAHMVKQLGRLAAGVVGSVVLSLTAGGPGPLDWKMLPPMVAAAVWTQLANQWPQVPWQLLRVRLGLPAPLPPAVDGDIVLRGHSGYTTSVQGIEATLGETASAASPAASGSSTG